MLPRIVAATLLVLVACGPGAGTTGGASTEPGVTPSESPIDWLLEGPGAAALRAVPGSTWTTEAGVAVSASCGPTDALEGWRVSGNVVAADEIGEGFDGGVAFERADTGGPSAWAHVDEERLRLVEGPDGGVDFELFVPVDEAPEWEAVDRVDVEVLFGGERCG